MQCIVQKDGASFESNTGTVYRAWYGDQSRSYEAICAGRGDSNIQKDLLKYCAYYVSICSDHSGYSEAQGISKMKCVVESLEEDHGIEQICNGGHYTLVAASGNWSYRGYKGSITMVDYDPNQKKGACFAICNLADTYYYEYLKTL